MASIHPDAEQLERLRDAVPSGEAIVMINLLRYREHAHYEGDYPEGFDSSPCSGRDAYQQRYGPVAAARVAANGGRLVWLGAVASTVIGPSAEEWDDAVLVEYPSREAFIHMTNEDEYRFGEPHRTAALADSRLIATTGGQLIPPG